MYRKKIYVFLSLYTKIETHFIHFSCIKREKIVFHCNCIIRWPFSLQYLYKICICLQLNWSKMFVNCIIKCITRRYMFLHVYIQFSLVYTKQKQNLYTSVYKAREASRGRVASENGRVASEIFGREAPHKLWLTFAMEHN